MKRTVYGYQYITGNGPESRKEREAIMDFPVTVANFYTDGNSGKGGARKQYSRLVDGLLPGDLVVIGSLEQLGDSYEECLRQWKRITGEKKADILVLDTPFDTRPEAGKVSAGSAAELVLENLCRAEQKTKDMHKKRQREGIDSARERGVRFGRPCKEVASDFPEVSQAWKRREYSSREAARRLGVSQNTFLSWVRKADQEAG